jgi:hypothetical protein
MGSGFSRRIHHQCLLVHRGSNSSMIRRESSVGPLDGFRHRSIVVGNKGEDLIAEIVQRGEISAFEQLAHENTQPDFHLIHPGGMLRGVVKDHLMSQIMQERRTPNVSWSIPSRWATQRTSDSD